MANAIEVPSFRFLKQVVVGQDKEQVVILIGPPTSATTDPAEIEKMARRFWPSIRGQATEAWVYPLGWYLYFSGDRLVDMTQYLPTS